MPIRHLLDDFVPENYSISITLLENDLFMGSVTISGVAKAKTVSLHAKDMEILRVRVNETEATWQSVENDEIIIISDTIVPNKKLELMVFYEGKIQDSMHGFYKSHWSKDGVEHTLLATQFESIHARKAFPCIDEPAAKATFSLSLGAPEGQTVLSNMPILHQVTTDGLTSTFFETTPRMSTYLLAWAIGDLQQKSVETKRGVKVSVYATPAQDPASLDFAADFATRAIDFYEDFYQTKYPLTKSDHLALPDFSSGAMENWGLITYRESALLVESNASIEQKQGVATVIAHELAHQWFGNLVTMKWWDDLWLNESFANIMEYLSTDKLEPDWQMWREFNAHEGSYAMKRDAIDGVQSVHVDIDHPDEIDTIFDGAIVYAKGGRLLRMLQTYVGEDTFRQGLKIYFDRHKYSNTSADDLWQALSEASGKNVKQFMDPWLYQPGYPMISVTLKDNHLNLKQERFFTSTHGADDSVWPIPLDSNLTELPDLFDTAALTIDLKNPNDLILLNQRDRAHFITNYDDQLFNRILEAVKNGQLAPEMRLAFLRNILMLNRADVIASDRLIDVLLAYSNEASDLGWSMMSSILGELRKFNQPDSAEDNKLNQFIIQLASGQFARLGWSPKKNENIEGTKLRSNIIGLMLNADEPSTVKKARHIFDTEAIEQIDSELRASVLMSVIKNGDNAIFDKLFTSYPKSHTPSLRSDLMGALTNTKSDIKAAQILEKLRDSKTIRPQDAQIWWVYLLSNRRHRQAAWQWLKTNWAWAEKTYKGDMSYDSFPRYAGNILNTSNQLREYHEFFQLLKSDPGLTRTIRLGELDIKSRVKQIEKDIVAVHQRLKLL